MTVQNLKVHGEGTEFNVGKTHTVPRLPSEIHKDTNIPYASSPESLDEVLAEDFTPNNSLDTLEGRRKDIKPLSGDYDTPFSMSNDPSFDPAEDLDVRTTPDLDPTHPKTDSASDIDSTQIYNENLSGAAEAPEPNAGNSVVDFHPRTA